MHPITAHAKWDPRCCMLCARFARLYAPGEMLRAVQRRWLRALPQGFQAPKQRVAPSRLWVDPAAANLAGTRGVLLPPAALSLETESSHALLVESARSAVCRSMEHRRSCRGWRASLVQSLLYSMCAKQGRKWSHVHEQERRGSACRACKVVLQERLVQRGKKVVRVLAPPALQVL